MGYQLYMVMLCGVVAEVALGVTPNAQTPAFPVVAEVPDAANASVSAGSWGGRPGVHARQLLVPTAPLQLVQAGA